MWIVIICWSSCDVIILRFTLPFWSSRFLYVTKKSRQILNILRTKRAFKVKWKVFFIIFKGLSLKQIRQILWKVRVQLSFINWLITDRWPARLLIFLMKIHMFKMNKNDTRTTSNGSLFYDTYRRVYYVQKQSSAAVL